MPTNAERKATQARTTAFLDAYKKEIVKEFGSTLVHKISVNENEKTQQQHQTNERTNERTNEPAATATSKSSK